MDPVTHLVTGAAIQQIGLRQRIGRDALLVGAIAGAIVDLDIFIPITLKFLGKSSPTDMFVYHRGMTHSFVFAPLVALVCSVVWMLGRKLWSKRRKRMGKPALSAVPYWLLFISCLLPVVLHILIDACTSYGTQLFWPVLPDRVAWNSVAIIDLFFTIIPILVLLGCFITGKIIKDSAKVIKVTTTIGVVGMVLMTGYLAMGNVLRDQAIGLAARSYVGEKNGTAPRVSIEKTQTFMENHKSRGAYPVLGTPFLWRVVFENDRQWVICAVNLLKPGQVKTTTVEKEQSPFIDLARSNLQMKTFDWFANKMLRAEVSRKGPWVLVDFHDMRYGWPTEGKDSIWAFRFVYDKSGELINIGQVHTTDRKKIRKEMLNKVLGKK